MLLSLRRCQTESVDPPAGPRAPARPLARACLPTSLFPIHSFGLARKCSRCGPWCGRNLLLRLPHREEPQGPAELQSRSSGPLPQGLGREGWGTCSGPREGPATHQTGPLTDLTKPAGPRDSENGSAAHSTWGGPKMPSALGTTCVGSPPCPLLRQGI